MASVDNAHKIDRAEIFKSLTPAKAPEDSKKQALESSQTMMRLFLTQLKYQNPMEENQDPTKMITQLAQMSQVQQANETNNKLDRVIDLLKTGKQFEAAGLLDKNIIAPGNKINFSNHHVDRSDGKNHLNFDKVKGKINLPILPLGVEKAVQKFNDVKLRVLTQEGKEIGTMNFGQQASGSVVPFEFSKLDVNKFLNNDELDAALQGDLKIDAQAMFNGQWMAASTAVGTKISSVLIDGQDYMVSGDDGQKVKISDLNEIY